MRRIRLLIYLFIPVLFTTCLPLPVCTQEKASFQVSTISLTAAEKNWLAKNPVISMAVPINVPRSYYNKNGNFQGITIDYIRLIEQRLDIRFDLRISILDTALNRALKHEVDCIVNVAKTKERTQYLDFTEVYLSVPQAVVAHKNEKEILDLSELNGRTVAVKKSSVRIDYLKENYPDIDLIEVDDKTKILPAVVTLKADAGFDNVDSIISLMQDMMLPGLKVIHLKYLPPTGYASIGVRKDKPILASILNKAVLSISDEEKNRIAAKWLGIKPAPAPKAIKDAGIPGEDAGLSAQKKQQLVLTEDEKKWLKQHPVITLAIDDTYPPLNYVDEKGNLKGLNVDYINLFAQKVGLKIEYQGSVWSIAINKALSHDVDGVVNADATEERKKHLNFTVPYITLPSCLVTLKSTPKINLIEDLDDQIICVKNNSSHLGLIKRKSKVRILPIETLEQGLDLVIKGEATGVFDDVSVLGHLISKYNFVNLKINLIHYDDVVGVSRLGLRNNDPVMLDIVNKAISSVTEQERQNIQSKWLSLVKEKTVIEKHIDWVRLFKYALPFFAVIFFLYLVILIHNLRLRHVVAEKTYDLREKTKALEIEIRKREQSEEKFRNLFEYSMDAIFIIDEKVRFLDCNPASLKLFGIDTKEQFLTLSPIYLSPANQPDGQSSIVKADKMTQIALKEGRYFFEWRHKQLDGREFDASVLFSKVKIAGQTVVQATVRDISEQKNAQELLIQSEKMMSVGGLAAGMAHEINNPLAGVIQNVNVLKNRLTDVNMPANIKAAESVNTSMDVITHFMKSRGIPRILNAITDSGQRMASLVENMLSFARKTDSSFSTHDITDLLDSVITLAASDFDLKKNYDFKSISIIKNYEDNLPMLACEGGKIQQVFLNILNNGAYAMCEKKSVALQRHFDI